MGRSVLTGTAQAGTTRIGLEGIGSGACVLLLHDGGINRSQTVAALPRLIEALSARGYRFVQIC